MIHHRLVTDLGHKQLHVEPTLRRGGDGVEHRLVGHKVRTRNNDAFLRRVEQRVEQPQVVFTLEAGTARHNLRVERRRGRLQRARLGFAQQQFVGLAVPVGDKQCVDSGDDGAFEAHHQVFPLQSALQVAAFVVAAVDHVLRPGEGDIAVKDEQLAVVAQVGPAPFPAEGAHRKHQVPVDPDGFELFDGGEIAGGAEGCHVVQQYPNRHSTFDRGLERIEERGGGGVKREDVELGVDVAVRLVDGVGHRRQ